jgi:drug/metabolite transporter (DMT)-like permease
MLDIRLLFVALVWGVNFTVVKYALASFEPLAFTVIRFSLAAAFLLVVMRLRGVSFSLQPGDRFAVVMLGFLGITVYNLFFMYGLRLTTASNSALLISLSPLAGAVLQAVSGKERITARIAGALCLASAGVVLVIRSRHDAFTVSPSGLAGDLLTLCAAFAWALYTLRAKPLLEKYPAVTVTTYAMLSGTALLLPLSLPELTAQHWDSLSVVSWASLSFSAFLAAGLAYVLWYQGVKRVGVMRTMMYHYLMPFAAVLFSAIVLKEKVSLLLILGGLAILLGVALSQQRKNT